MKLNLKSYPLIGMIHLPNIQEAENIEQLLQYAISEAQILQDLDYSAILVENFNDTPFPKSTISDEILIKFSLIINELKKHVNIPIGLNILRNACVQAMEIASILKLPFIRCNIWEGAYVTDQGIIEGVAFDVLAKKRYYASETKVLADILVKHATPMSDFSILEAAENALKRGNADQVIVSGRSTGQGPEIKNIKVLSENKIKPILGSGLNMHNLKLYAEFISGAIIGTAIKIDKNAKNQIDKTLASDFIQIWKETFDSFSR